MYQHLKLTQFSVLLVFLTVLISGCQTKTSNTDLGGKNVYSVVTDGSSDVSIYVVFPLQENQEDRIAGLPHYAEHLVWANLSHDTHRNLDQHSNAWTNHKTMGYWLSGPKDDFKRMLKQLTKVFQPLSATPEFAKEERDIVLREYELRSENTIQFRANSDMDKFLYQGNARAAPLMGNPEDIVTFSYGDAKALHAATHRTDNAVFLVVGDIKPSQIIQTVEQSSIPLLEYSAIEKAPESFSLSDSETKVTEYDALNEEPRAIWRKVMALEEKVDFELLKLQSYVLALILESSLPGGLAGALRYDNFIASSFSVDVLLLDDQHVEVQFSASPDNDVSLFELHTAFEETFEQVSKEEIPFETFNRVKARLESYWPDWDDEKDKAKWMAKYSLKRISNARKPLSIVKLQELDSQLTLNGVNALLKGLQIPGRKAVAYIGSTRGDEL